MKKILLVCITSTSIFAQSGDNLELLFNWNDSTIVGTSAYNNAYNEVWGLVVNGREFAVIGSTSGTHIFDVTDPFNSEQVQFIPGAAAGTQIIHRDYHDRDGYLYSVSDEGNSTLQIIDIKQLPNAAPVLYDSNELIKTAHNIFIDENLNKLYACNVRSASSSGWNAASLVIFDIENPINPVQLISYEVPGSGYNVHDMWVKNDTAFLNNGGDGLFVVDFTDLTSPQIIGSLTDYSDKGYNHSGWPTADMKTYIMADEDWGYDMKVLDISNLTDIEEITTFSSEIHPNSIAHNQLIKDNYLYVSSYHDGLQVYDISDRENPTKVASFSTYLMDDHDSYRGAWGVYPFLPSGNILVSDMQYGLYVLAPSQDFSVQNYTLKKITVYPNPAKTQIKLKVNGKESALNVKIFDLKGQIVMRKKISHENNLINISSLKHGIYLIKANGENSIFQRKLIVH